MSERWIIVKPDGSLILHEENDGAVFLRKGPQASEKIITLDEVPQHRLKEVAADALAQLAKQSKEK